MCLLGASSSWEPTSSSFENRDSSMWSILPHTLGNTQQGLEILLAVTMRRQCSQYGWVGPEDAVELLQCIVLTHNKEWASPGSLKRIGVID